VVVVEAIRRRRNRAGSRAVVEEIVGVGVVVAAADAAELQSNT
jgi:hypothetical protein